MECKKVGTKQGIVNKNCSSPRPATRDQAINCLLVEDKRRLQQEKIEMLGSAKPAFNHEK
jgi:hypothetical protein